MLICVIKGEINMNKEQLVAILSKGFHLVEFTKKSGERVARVLTLDPNLIPEFVPKTDRITKQATHTVRAWDHDNQKFCTVIPENVFSSN
jgi:hypothetical protein